VAHSFAPKNYTVKFWKANENPDSPSPIVQGVFDRDQGVITCTSPGFPAVQAMLSLLVNDTPFLSGSVSSVTYYVPASNYSLVRPASGLYRRSGGNMLRLKLGGLASSLRLNGIAVLSTSNASAGEYMIRILVLPFLVQRNCAALRM
jgi:hypothetical protein